MMLDEPRPVMAVTIKVFPPDVEGANGTATTSGLFPATALPTA
jgi:hypothetical protein